MTGRRRPSPILYASWLKHACYAVALVLVVLAPGAGDAQARAAGPACQYVLGFATLHALDPADVGDCVDNQAFAANGDAQQHSTNGLLVWRKADNWTAFTNGYWSWINGPDGLAKRLNSQRFAWEANPDGLPLVPEGKPAAANGAPAPAGPTVGQYDVFEQTITYPSGALANPWEDVTVTATFMTPSGNAVTIHGFYYDTDTYKVRFDPEELGRYTYTIAVTGPTPTAARAGAFTVIPSAAKGFARPLPTNPRRLGFADGSLFNAIGLNDCWPNLLPLHGVIGFGQQVDIDTYFSTYADAGFNLLRWNPGNCSAMVYRSISTTGNTYLVPEGKTGDALLQAAARHGFHVLFTFFYAPVYSDAATNDGEQAAIERYLGYAMARYGAYVDMWELGNEDGDAPSSLPTPWLQFAARYVHDHDPYHRIVTNSYPRNGDWRYLDARSPHWYETEPDRASDVATADAIASNRFDDLPIIFGEQGNGTCNWDPTSALRMRLRSWTAFFDAATLVFWNSSFKKNYCTGAANLYLGDEERGYVRVLQDFTAHADAGVEPRALTPSNPGVHAYGLQSPRVFLAYFHHFTDHTQPVTTSLVVTLPDAGTADWIDPATGATLGQAAVPAGTLTLASPPFTVDLALRITSSTTGTSAAAYGVRTGAA